MCKNFNINTTADSDEFARIEAVAIANAADGIAAWTAIVYEDIKAGNDAGIKRKESAILCLGKLFSKHGQTAELGVPDITCLISFPAVLCVSLLYFDAIRYFTTHITKLYRNV